MDKSKIFAAVVLACGLVGLGFLVKCGVERIAEKSSYVSVKGLAEREVNADKVVWPIQLTVLSNDLNEIYDLSTAKTNKVVAFLKQNGVTDAEITISATNVTDRTENQWSNERIVMRYYASNVVTVTSNNVENVRAIMQKQNELLKQGVAISAADSWSENAIRYEYTGLNQMKPEMIEEATKNARMVAEKFALDSQSELGKIRFANQGQFSISDRDANTPYIKVVRVVTTVEYFLN